MKRPNLKVIQGGLGTDLPTLPRVVTRIHSREYWEKEYARLARRLERIAMLNAGRAEVKVVQVQPCWVERHKRGAHERIVITTKRDKRRAK